MSFVFPKMSASVGLESEPASSVAVFRTDEWGNAVCVNSKWIELTGLSIELMQPAGWLAAVCLPERQRVLCAWRQALETGRGFRAAFRIIAKSGRGPWVLGQIEVELGKAGRPQGFIGVVSALPAFALSLYPTPEAAAGTSYCFTHSVLQRRMSRAGFWTVRQTTTAAS